MAGARALRSASKSSPASSKSTPRARATRNSRPEGTGGQGTPKTGSARAGGMGSKTSPYFSKVSSSPLARGASARSQGKAKTSGSGSRKPQSSGTAKAKAKIEYDSATGMTTTEDEDETESEEDPEASEDEFEPPGAEGGEEEEEEVDSDEIDEPSEAEDEDDSEEEGARRKRKRGGRKTDKYIPMKANGSGKKPKWKRDEEEGYGDIELEEGQEIAGRIYPAPTTGLVPAGRISQNTMEFLANLQIPERNDRDWFKSHEPSFRQAEKEWKAFVGLVQEEFHDADDEIPILPPKDIIHRIYRDVRFSSDKTPYKKNFSLSTSRGGRKGIWAGYYLQISPNGNSMIAAGVWQPDKNELANIRQSIATDPKGFRDVIGAPPFVKLFGPAKEHPKGKRQNVFGHDDALKYAPKGVDKAHKDIDLLKLRSVAVVHKFSDEEVVAINFREKVKEVVAVMAPFVHKLNDMIALPSDGDDDNEGEGDDGEEGADDED